MHSGMTSASKDVRMDFRARQDVKDDSLIVAEMRRGNLTELITDLLVTEIEKKRKEDPELWADAAKRVAKRKEKEQDKPRKKKIKRPAIATRIPSNGAPRR